MLHPLFLDASSAVQNLETRGLIVKNDCNTQQDGVVTSTTICHLSRFADKLPDQQKLQVKGAQCFAPALLASSIACFKLAAALLLQFLEFHTHYLSPELPLKHSTSNTISVLKAGQNRLFCVMAHICS